MPPVPTTEVTPSEMSLRPLRHLDTPPCEEAGSKKRRGRRPLNDLSDLSKKSFPVEYEASYEPPAFTIKELRDCVPAHLFIRSLWKSIAYTVANLTAIVVLFYLATWIPKAPYYFRFLLWPAYWWLQGVAGVGVWILAHECGHQAFSDSKALNNSFGFFLHTLVLVPYHSWRISHSQHHASTANTCLDQAYVPRTKSEYRSQGEPSPWEEAIEESPIFTLVTLMAMLLFGWPAYFFLHMSGRNYEGRLATHFLPSSPIFQEKHKWQILASDLGILSMVGGLVYWAHVTTPWTMISLYGKSLYHGSCPSCPVETATFLTYFFCGEGIPYLIVNAWLITITLLQHTDVYLPHYTPQSWNFVRGALSTVGTENLFESF